MKHWIAYGILALVVLAALYWVHRQEVALAVAQEHVKSLDAAVAAAEQARQKAIADLEAERAKPATIQTVTKFLPAPLPKGSEVKIEQLPDAPTPQLVVSGDAQANLQAIQDMEIKHLECDTNLAACNQKLTAETQKAATWEQTAKGGSKTHRFMKVLKVVGCAGGGAALGSLWKAKGAAIGGAAGAAGCELLF